MNSTAYVASQGAGVMSLLIQLQVKRVLEIDISTIHSLNFEFACLSVCFKNADSTELNIVVNIHAR